VEIRWKNRKAACETLVLPGEDEILLDAYPMSVSMATHKTPSEIISEMVHERATVSAP
jgi:hypothetical protein